MSIRPSHSIVYAPHVKDRTPLDFRSTKSGVPQEEPQEDKTPQELPPNQAPLPEIASSDPPKPCHELPSSDPATREQVHPEALQPGRSGPRPYSASSLFQAPQPYGLAFKPHSPSQLSEMSSLGSPPPLAHGLSPVSVTKDGVSADV